MAIFVLDHCIWKETENALCRAGFNCITLRQLGKTEASNGEIIALAKDKKAILITRDRDFANPTLYPPGSHAGIIVLRITPKTMDAVHDNLIKTLQSLTLEQLSKNLLIITSTSYRLHKTK